MKTITICKPVWNSVLCHVEKNFSMHLAGKTVGDSPGTYRKLRVSDLGPELFSCHYPSAGSDQRGLSLDGSILCHAGIVSPSDSSLNPSPAHHLLRAAGQILLPGTCSVSSVRSQACSWTNAEVFDTPLLAWHKCYLLAEFTQPNCLFVSQLPFMCQACLVSEMTTLRHLFL